MNEKERLEGLLPTKGEQGDRAINAEHLQTPAHLTPNRVFMSERSTLVALSVKPHAVKCTNLRCTLHYFQQMHLPVLYKPFPRY